MHITYANDTEPGWGLFRCTGEDFPDVPLRMSLQRSRDHRFLGSDGHWFTRPVYLEVGQVREGADLVLLLGPEIVSQLTDTAHRVGLLAPDDTLFKGQLVIKGVRYADKPRYPMSDQEAERLRREAEQRVRRGVQAQAARGEAERLRREAEAQAQAARGEAAPPVVAASPAASLDNRAPAPGPKDVFVNSIGMAFVPILSGTFRMGSADNDELAFADEKPRHEVTISRAFYLGKHPVTQSQWRRVMRDNPSKNKGPDGPAGAMNGDDAQDDCPVENVSWEHIQEFIRLLNAQEGHNRYRLPTEAEWEYACRAGSETAYAFGDNAVRLHDHAWFGDNAGMTTHAVGRKQPNAWGLYDMCGNVWEWVHDWYGAYSAGPVVDPQGPETGEERVLRGGCWNNDARSCRSAHRVHGRPDRRIGNGGFRLVLAMQE